MKPDTVKARARGPARFTLDSYSSAFQQTTTWRVTVTESGVSARRQDGRELSIGWRELLGAAMVYGRDSERRTNGTNGN